MLLSSVFTVCMVPYARPNIFKDLLICVIQTMRNLIMSGLSLNMIDTAPNVGNLVKVICLHFKLKD